MISCGITAAALSGLKYGIRRLVSEVADQLFLDDREKILKDFFSYNEIEFVGEWTKKE